MEELFYNLDQFSSYTKNYSIKNQMFNLLTLNFYSAFSLVLWVFLMIFLSSSSILSASFISYKIFFYFCSSFEISLILFSRSFIFLRIVFRRSYFSTSSFLYQLFIKFFRDSTFIYLTLSLLSLFCDISCSFSSFIRF